METNKQGNQAPDWGKDYGLRELWSEISSGLFVGGTHDDDTVMNGRGRQDPAEISKDDFDSVVSLYAWARPVDWGVEEYRWGIYDGGEGPPIEDILDVVVWAHTKWKQGNRTLIRCQAGLSRSSFIAALVLIRDGLTIDEAVALIREKRSQYCLNVNASSARGAFTRILRDTPVEFWRG